MIPNPCSILHTETGFVEYRMVGKEPPSFLWELERDKVDAKSVAIPASTLMVN